jgi:hypothetical protein
LSHFSVCSVSVVSVKVVTLYSAVILCGGAVILWYYVGTKYTRCKVGK